MPTTRRESSTDSAGRSLASRRNKPAPYRRALASRGVPPSRPLVATRIACDFAEPTLRLIREVLRDAIQANFDFGDRGALLLIAEEMVAAALGEPPCDDPPLTDREGA